MASLHVFFFAVDPKGGSIITTEEDGRLELYSNELRMSIIIRIALGLLNSTGEHYCAIRYCYY